MSPNDLIIFLCSAIVTYQLRNVFFWLKQEKLRRRLNAKR